MPANIWPRERMEALAELWREGWSFSELRDRLCEQFGIFCTRSAISGKVARMKLKTTEPRIRIAPPKPRAPRKIVAAVPLKPIKVESPPREPFRPLMIDLLDLNRTTCRFPYGDWPPLRYCGCHVLPGSPYCRTHTALCWNHPPQETNP